MRFPKKRMLTHASSVPRGLSLSLPPSPMSCFSWEWMVSKPSLPRSSAAPSVHCCIICPVTATPPSTGSRAASRTDIHGPTSRGPSGPACIFLTKAQYWAPYKVGSGLFPVGVRKYLALWVRPTSTGVIPGSISYPISLVMLQLVHAHLRRGAGGNGPSDNRDGGVSGGQSPSHIRRSITHQIPAIAGGVAVTAHP